MAEGQCNELVLLVLLIILSIQIVAFLTYQNQQEA